MLARALSHDLPMGRLRTLWLEQADMDRLLADDARARAWSKRFLTPFIWAVGATRRFGASIDSEVRRNLSLFVRSRWFEPPLDGMHMAELMYDAVACMGKPKTPRSSLLPSGHQLDLFVTLTDYYGCSQLIQIHDPPLIRELTHRHGLHFRYRRYPNGVVASDFEFENAPALAFAARATSSFPGVFPPAQIAEIDRLMARRSTPWPTRDAFIARNFTRYADAGIDPVTTPFIDGAVLNNKPFREAIQAIRGRPAYRQVDRRLVYIDPDPAAPAIGHAGTPVAKFLRDHQGRAVGYSAHRADRRRVELGHRLQRSGAAAESHHRISPAADHPAGHRYGRRGARPARSERIGNPHLARAYQCPDRARRRFRL